LIGAGTLAELRAEEGKLLGFPNGAAWKLEDQMATTPEAAIKVYGRRGAPVTSRATAEGKGIQAVIAP